MKKSPSLYLCILISFFLLSCSTVKKEIVDDISDFSSTDFQGSYDLYIRVYDQDQPIQGNMQIKNDKVFSEVVENGEIVSSEMTFSDFLANLVEPFLLRYVPNENDIKSIKSQGIRISHNPFLYRIKNGLKCEYTVKSKGRRSEVVFSFIKSNKKSQNY